MAHQLTANPAVNRLLDKLNNTRKAEGKPQITRVTLSDKKDSKMMYRKKVPMQGLIHLTAGRGVSREEIERRYQAQKPSIFHRISLGFQSIFR